MLTVDGSLAALESKTFGLCQYEVFLVHLKNPLMSFDVASRRYYLCKLFLNPKAFRVAFT